MTGAIGRSSPDFGVFQPPTLETLPEAVARNEAIARGAEGILPSHRPRGAG